MWGSRWVTKEMGKFLLGAGDRTARSTHYRLWALTPTMGSCDMWTLTLLTNILEPSLYQLHQGIFDHCVNESELRGMTPNFSPSLSTKAQTGLFPATFTNHSAFVSSQKKMFPNTALGYSHHLLSLYPHFCVSRQDVLFGITSSGSQAPTYDLLASVRWTAYFDAKELCILFFQCNKHVQLPLRVSLLLGNITVIKKSNL